MSRSAAEAAKLREVAAEIDKTAGDEMRAAEAVREVAAQRQRESPWRAIVATGEARALLELLAVCGRRLRADTSALRRLVISGLAEEDLTLRQIGRLFHVSHQRIYSVLGRQSRQ